MKVFLNVGAHFGQTIEPALDPKYGFDRIIAFEPVLSNVEVIRKTFRDPRVETYPIGLWNQTTEVKIYLPGTQAASVFQDKNNATSYEVCKMVKASDWIKENLGPDDRIVLKINAEGVECDIVDDLIDADLMSRIDFMLMTFDCEKIPSQAHRSVELRSRLQKIGFNRYFVWDGFFHMREPGRLEFIFRGRNHKQFLEHWMDAYGVADQRGFVNAVRQRSFELKSIVARTSFLVQRSVRHRIINKFDPKPR